MPDPQRDSNEERSYKMSSSENPEGSQNPVYKVTRLKSDFKDPEDMGDPIRNNARNIQYQRPYEEQLQHGDNSRRSHPRPDSGRRKASQNSYRSNFDSLEDNANISSSESEEAMGEINLAYDVNNMKEEGHKKNLENMLPEPPLRMTYILPKELPDFRYTKDDKEGIPPHGGAPSPTQDLDFDDVLPHLGEFGRYQKILFLAMIPFAFSVAFVYFAQIFIAVIPERYWCRIPELSHLYPEQRKHLSIPLKGDTYDACSMYAVNYTALVASGVTEPDPSWPISECQWGWEYDFTDVPYSSIATKLNWVCAQDTLPTLATAIFFCGAIVGGLVFGWVADHFGRVPALIGTNLTGFIAGVVTAFATSFWQFAACRFFVGLAFDNCFTMMYILVLEYVGPSWRTFVANMSIAIFFTMAASALPWIAYYVANWQYLCIITSLPLLVAVFTPWIVPESARWLVSQGRVDEAVVIMKKFEKINKKKVDPKLYQQLKETCQRVAKQETEEKKYSVLDLFKTPRLRNITCLLIVIWMAISLVFDGHVRQVGNLGLDLFVTFSLASATELPADTLLTFTLDRWGRRWYACGTMVFSGVFSLLSSSMETGKLSAGMAIIGRFLVNISYNTGLQYAAEVLPTVVRAQGVALIHIMGYVASIVSPFIVYLSVINPKLPLIVLGIIGILGGILCLFLPETLGKDLPQTLQDGEDFGVEQRFLDFPCCGNKLEDNPKEDSKPYFKRGQLSQSSTRSSIRTSLRGEQFRSSLIQRKFQRTDLGY